MKPTKYLLPLLFVGVVPCAGAPFVPTAHSPLVPTLGKNAADSTVTTPAQNLNEATVTAHAEATMAPVRLAARRP